MNVQSQTATIFVVDDDPDARVGLQRLLSSYDYETEVFPSAREFLQRLPIECEGCVILDQQMPEMTGMELLDELAKKDFNLPIIFLTAHGDIRTSVKAIKQGAEDFLPKLAEESELMDTITRALQQSRSLSDDAARTKHVQQLVDRLTVREREVLGYVVAGWTNGQIARKLDIVERTVKAHRAKVMQKFEVDSLADLVRQAMIAGIEGPENYVKARDNCRGPQTLETRH